MRPPELTLEAAIRDASAPRVAARHAAVRALAPALLAELNRPGPLWRATARHPRGPEVRSALLAPLEHEEDIPLAALAATGLGMLGEPAVLDAVEPWADREGTDDLCGLQRECAVIATGYVGVAARAAPDAKAIHAPLLARLRAWISSPHPDVRFQAARALVEVGGSQAEAELAAALRTEDDRNVREGLVDALSRLETICEASAQVLRDIVRDEEEGPDLLGFEAAMVLAGARNAEAGPRLVDALAVRHQRDRALEALAVLGPATGAEAAERVSALAFRWRTPGVTRVRAAYALARMQGGATRAGRSLLRRLRWHPLPSVRDAVADAERNLVALG